MGRVIIKSEVTNMACDTTYRRYIRNNAHQDGYQPYIPVTTPMKCGRHSKAFKMRNGLRRAGCFCGTIYVISGKDTKNEYNDLPLELLKP